MSLILVQRNRREKEICFQRTRGRLPAQVIGREGRGLAL
jgi:hypothetical protein